MRSDRCRSARTHCSPISPTPTNYQDLWWATGGVESGWGINLAHQGDVIFATWFTYDVDGTPMWLSATAPKTAQGVYSGELIRTNGPSFAAMPFDRALVQRTPVGSATFTFANGNAGTFAYTVNGVSQVKSISRLLFAPPAGTLCESSGTTADDERLTLADDVHVQFRLRIIRARRSRSAPARSTCWRRSRQRVRLPRQPESSACPIGVRGCFSTR